MVTAEEPIEVDPALLGDGDDESYETDTASGASTSISESVRDFAFENNRRYHKFREGVYHFPNDEPEQAREDMKHSMIVNLCDGKLHFAPLENPQAVLDIGTGTGIWVVDMADEYPEADVLGIDLSPIQPEWVPPNARFMVDDAEADWVYKPDSLDYIHIRHMTGAIRNWTNLLSQAYKALKPGGWIELQDFYMEVTCDDGTMPDDDPVYDWLETVGKALAALGVNLKSAAKNPENLRAAGFVNVEKNVSRVPIGVWPREAKLKTVGLYNRANILDGLQGISMGPFTRGLKWTPEEVELYLVKVRKGVMNTRVHSYLPFYAVYGQKPVS
ncbi:S-adenosyl-L-methionine-dependent methyltransferase [Cercophora newfieldiana]|uniref:S-adenosyl-L-methionine-dependent methyltransferase n=1 Tax=Cercophora newfieldiana TaxID=92897 RepID=A0AA39XVY9_9PEZI|nr:S-adenosyl-L-methionine-dependent methyltransferase [Cercophora newfieldiana]